MALAPLLHNAAVLDLCGSDLVLPEDAPCLESTGVFQRSAKAGLSALSGIAPTLHQCCGENGT